MNYSNPFGSYPPSAVVDNLLGESYHVVKTVYNSLGLLSELAESDSLEFIQTNWEEMAPLIEAGSAIKDVSENLEEILQSKEFASDAAAKAELAKKWATQEDTPVEGDKYSSKYWAGKAQEVSGTLETAIENLTSISEEIEGYMPSINIIEENIEDIQTTASNAGIINIIATDLKGELTGSEGISTDMGMVGDPEPDQSDIIITGGNIKTVAENIGYVRKVADKLADIEKVSGSLDQLPQIQQELSEAVEKAEKASNIAQESIKQVEQYVSNAEDYQQYAKDWAIKMDGKVLDTDFSAKYYATEAKESAESAEQSASDANVFSNTAETASNLAQEAAKTATTNAESSKFYMQMAKMWAIKTDAPVEGDENSAKYYAYRAREDRLLATDWAIKLDGKVNGEDYSSKYWAQTAEAYAKQAQEDAEYVSQNTQIIIDNIEDISTVADNIDAVTAVGDNIQMVINVGADLVGDTTLDNILDYGVLGDDNPEVPVITGGNIRLVVENLETITKLTEMIERGELDEVVNAAAVVSKALDELQDVKDAVEDFKNEAEASKNEAGNQAQLAKDWANKTDGSVDGEEYSAKYYAQQAKASVDSLETTTESNLEEINQTAEEKLQAIENQKAESLKALTDQEAVSKNAIGQTAANQITLIQSAGDLAEQQINDLVDDAKSEADRAKTEADKAGASAVEADLSAKSSEDWSKLAEDWAIKTDGLVHDEDYSSKYYAQQAQNSYESTAQVLPDIEQAKNSAISTIQTTGADETAKVTAEGTKQINLITTEGSTQVIRVTDQGTSSVNAVKAQETSSIEAVEEAGAEQIALATAQAQAAQQSASAASESASDASDSAIAASQSASNALASEQAAKASENASKQSENNARDSENNAAESAVSASSYATQAAQSAIQAANAQINSDWEVTDTSSKAYILNKPDMTLYAKKSDLTTLFSFGGVVGDLSEVPEDAPLNSVWHLSTDGSEYIKLSTGLEFLGKIMDLSPYLLSETASATYLKKTDNAVSASKLQTPVLISIAGDSSGSASFDGSTATTITVSNSFASVAGKLQTPRTISVSGDGTASGSFDGSQNVDLVFTLNNSGVTADTYAENETTQLGFAGSFVVPEITVDAKGRVTSVVDKAITLPATPTSVTGNAGTATKLQTARTISISGDAVGTALFDGSADADIALTVNTAASAAKLNTARTISSTGDATWSVNFDGSANKSGVLTLANSGVTAGNYGLSANATPASGATFNVPYFTVDAKGRITAASTHTVAMPTAISGNAGTATKLATARTIITNLASTRAGSFDGSANVTNGVSGILPTANGGTGRSDGLAANVVQRFTLTARGDLEYGTNNTYLVDKAALAYWNGRYNNTSSNLEYCRLGSIVGTTGNQTIGGTKTFSAQIVASGGIAGDLTGTASEATHAASATTATTATTAAKANQLTTARTIKLAGAVTGSASFNGAGNITINTQFVTDYGMVGSS